MKIPNLISKVCVLSVLCLPLAHAYAQSELPTQYQACLDNVDHGAFKNSQWAACAAQEMARQDVILNTEYNKLRKTLSNEQKQSLTSGQKSWLAFRENWCKFEEQGPAAPGGIANYNFCMIELTNQQIAAIKNLQF